jgi:DtxR family Mn-dependent transcriptional regulator
MKPTLQYLNRTMLTFTEENYIKALLKLTEEVGVEAVGTNELAAHLGVKPATVTDMLKRLKEKQLVSYEKYGKVSLSVSGRSLAIDVLRKHRLWETFLCRCLGFPWHQVHEIAEQLEHIQSNELMDRLDAFLGFPQIDPHGDLIPSKDGVFQVKPKRTLSMLAATQSAVLIGVGDNSAAFLQYVDAVGLQLGSEILVKRIQPYDALIEIEINGKTSQVSQKFADQIFVDTPAQRDEISDVGLDVEGDL